MIKNQLDFIFRYSQSLKSFNPYISTQLRSQFLFVVLLIVGVVITNTIMIWLIGKPFDYLLQQDYGGFSEILILLALVIIVNQVFHYFNIYRASALGLEFIRDLRQRSLRQLCLSTTISTDLHSKGDLLARLSDDIDRVQRLLIESPFFFLSHVLTLILYSIMLFVIDWKLALLALALSPLFVLHQTLFAKPKAEASQNFLRENGKLLNNESEVLGSLKLVKSFNAFQNIFRRHAEVFERALNWALKERKLNAAFHTSLSLIVYICALIVVYIGVSEIEGGVISVAELVSFLIYMGYMSVPVRGIADLGFQVQADVMAGERVLELMNLPVESEVVAKDWRPTKGNIDINDLCFSVESRRILNHVSVKLSAGETYALVGQSGGGKSTLVNLMLKFLHPENGEIYVDGKALSELDPVAVRKDIGVVWQHAFFFTDTIRNNMLLAKLEANESQIVESLQQADAWDFVRSLPDGLDTQIGPGYVDLSGGQKQRLQIAQALLRDPLILILDEASSALDSQSEERVISNLNKVRLNKTTLIVTHRYSAIKHAKEIIYLNSDGTVTTGSHESLLSNHEDYRHAINWQTKNA